MKPPARSFGRLALVCAGCAIIGVLVAFGDRAKSQDATMAAGSGGSDRDLALRQAKSTSYAETVRRLLADLRASRGAAGASIDLQLRETLGRWLTEDPEICIRFLNGSDARGLLDDDLIRAILAQMDPLSASQPFVVGRQIEDASLRDRWLRIAFEGMAKRDPATAFQMFPGIPAVLRWEFAQTLAEAWAGADARAAFEAFKKWEGDGTNDLLGTVLARWAAKDPVAAVEATFTVDSESGSFLRREVLTGVGKASPSVAAIFLKRLQNNPTDRAAIQSLEDIAKLWVREEPDAALKWARSIGNDWQKNSILEQMGYGLAETNPAEAVKLADTLPSDRARREIIADVAARMARKNASESLAWAAAIQHPRIRESAMVNAFNFAMEYNKGGALKTILATENVAQWAPLIVRSLESRLQPIGFSSFKWDLDRDELSALRNVVIRELSPEQSAALEKVLTRYESRIK